MNAGPHAPETLSELQSWLAERDPAALRTVLEAAGVSAPDSDGASELAERWVNALHRRAHTPLGGLLRQTRLASVVDELADRVNVKLPEGTAWSRIAALTDALIPRDRPFVLGELPAEVRAKLKRPIWGRLAGASLAGSSLATRYLAGKLLGLTAGPAWRLLLLVPKLGPGMLAAKGAVATAFALSGPFAIGLALLVVNASFGPQLARVLPLVLGIGLLDRAELQVQASA